MTKEELIKILTFPEYSAFLNSRMEEFITIQTIQKYLGMFFNQNVVIPKCENSHKCADVFYKWAENPKQPIQFLDSLGQWCDLGLSNTDQYRIKPSEPVYEWAYYDRNGHIEWYTNDEYDEMMQSEPYECFKAEETKRERKQ